MKKAPYFNSPSIPSFRMFDFADDLGNYVEDPKLRCPVGLVFGTACPIDRVISMIDVLYPMTCIKKSILWYMFLPFPILPLLNHHIVCIYIFVLI